MHLRAVGVALRASSRVTAHILTAVHTVSCELVEPTPFHGSASRGSKRTALQFHDTPVIVMIERNVPVLILDVLVPVILLIEDGENEKWIHAGYVYTFLRARRTCGAVPPRAWPLRAIRASQLTPEFSWPMVFAVLNQDPDTQPGAIDANPSALVYTATLIQ
ncbi:hypothetical protein HYPSUDRAFT_208686 [Hypholoma sublateritium FD-334 SS-4]|uniref:Uncharacterized protein n=1 Tax=Hypholoma sublateritium (strain FD-334 SS-4) TaxID=945553 RepID=A0A0D2P1E7_HYPSF|nr:hypothetical protein HYPSUDRAFT_208686 [Hypholoma sublateritium FD-334 SS-4]